MKKFYSLPEIHQLHPIWHQSNEGLDSPFDERLTEESDSSSERRCLSPNMRWDDGEKSEDGKQNEPDDFDTEECSRVVCWMRSKSTAEIDS